MGPDAGTRSLDQAHGTLAVPVPALRRLFAYLGPGALIAVGYMDPGNWATDLAGGARFGYALLSVILIANLVAIFLQVQAVKLGVVTGRDLAQACRDRYSRPVARGLWVLAELAIAATDLAEVLGAAIAFKLLFGMPMVIGVALTALDVVLVIALQRLGFRWVEAVVAALVALIAGCFVWQLWLAGPAWSEVAGGLVPDARIVTDRERLYLALGIVGATVMPHNLYLHSALVQTRRHPPGDRGKRAAVRWASVDTVLALSIAFLVNAAILILAATVFHGTGHEEVASIQEAHRLLAPLLGTSAAATVFALALLASGLNATVTGTLAGQVVIEGFINVRLPPPLRRLVTRGIALVPALVVTAWWGDRGADALLVLSQVLLSVQLPFAIFPLIAATADRRAMGDAANGRWTTLCGWLIGGILVALNAWMLTKALQAWLG